MSGFSTPTFVWWFSNHLKALHLLLLQDGTVLALSSGVMQSSVTRTFGLNGLNSTKELTTCSELSSRKSASSTAQEEEKKEFVPFLREVEAMVDQAMKTVELQIADCVKALISDLPTAERDGLNGCAYSRRCRSKFRSIRHKGN